MHQVPEPRPADTARDILDIAERLVQTRGYNGFSYADIAAELSVTKASLHYHFSTKAVLGRALVTRYTEVFLRALGAIDEKERTAPKKLARYVGLYSAVLREDRLCLCGMLAAEYATLPEEIKDEIQSFFAANESWLAEVLEAGANAGTVRFRGTPLASARLILSTLEGAMLVARAYGGLDCFETTARHLLDDVILERAVHRRTAARGARKSA